MDKIKSSVESFEILCNFERLIKRKNGSENFGNFGNREEDERGLYFDLGNCEIISSCLDCQLINSKIRFERCLMMLEHQECRLFEFIDCHHTDILKITNF